MLRCSLCEAFYVGRTKRRLKDRLAEHKYAVRSGNCDYAMAKHFTETHTNAPATFTAIGIDHIPLNTRRGDRQRLLNQKESRWIHNLNTMQYPGLNDNIDMISFL